MNGTGGPIYTHMTALARLKRDAATPERSGDADTLRAVARQFEALFTHMLMKNMRTAGFGGGVFDSEQGKFYQDMFDEQLSTELSRGQGLGIAELLVRQLGRQGGRESAAPPAPTALAVPPRSGVTHTKEASAISGPEEFVQRFAPHAQRVGRALGVAPRFILAQAALETGWGSRPIRNADGTTSNNFFGIKAGSSWPGERAVVDTLEFSAGVGQRVKAAFRSYASAADGFADYARLISNSPRYRAALDAGEDGAAFAEALQRGGYATDPSYASKLLRIADGTTLKNAMSVLKIP